MNKGFSLVEMIVIIGIGTVIISLLASVFNLSIKSSEASEQKAEVSQNAAVFFDQLTRELRQAKNIVSSSPSSEIEFENGHAVFPITYIYYSLSGSDLMRQERRYFFPSEKDKSVRKTDKDSFGNPPQIEIMKNEIKAEYFKSLNFSLYQKVINVEAAMGRERDTEFRTKILGRNL